MRLNNKGFSLIELMAVLVITTIILVPLLSGLSDSYNANQRSQHRSNALSIAEGSLNALEKIDYSEIETLVGATREITDYVELNEDNCTDFDKNSNINMCTYIFSQVWNNEVYDQNTFKIFVFDFKLTEDQYDNIKGEVTIPQEVKDQIDDMFCPEGTCTFAASIDDNIVSLKNVIVWVQYYENPNKAIVLEGMLSDEEY